MIFRTPSCLLDSVLDLGLLREEVRTRTDGGPLFLVTGPRVSASPAFELVDRVLDGLGCGVVEFIKDSGEPEDAHIIEGVAVYRDAGCSGIIAVGGGSQLDTAKGIAVLAAHGGTPGVYRGSGRVPGPLPLLIAVATTAGSGSEVTPYAVITLKESGEKVLIASPWLIPDIAISEHRFLASLPDSILAASGVDALCHAVESFVSRKATPLSDRLALEAVAGVVAALPALLQESRNTDAAHRLAGAATLAGLCISNASVTLLHGMSRPLGVRFGLPHGLSNAVLLPAWAGFTEWFAKEKFQRLAAIVSPLLARGARRDPLSRCFEAFLAGIGVPTLADLVPERDELRRAASEMAAQAVASGSPANNPGQITEEEIAALYLKAWDGV